MSQQVFYTGTVKFVKNGSYETPIQSFVHFGAPQNISQMLWQMSGRDTLVVEKLIRYVNKVYFGGIEAWSDEKVLIYHLITRESPACEMNAQNKPLQARVHFNGSQNPTGGEINANVNYLYMQ